ncbi:MAG: hypothetical protein JWN38_963 [Candidatus Saccharibacteria bacterium]|nr:hypothetical protein [Candidatus Saccharibacteria bacterium]
MKPLRNFNDVHAALQLFVQQTPAVAAAYTLDRIRELLHRLGDPQDQLRVIHVAGTSGKTSTAYYIATMLTEAGQQVGLSVSPHLDEVNERLQINLEPLAEAAYCRALGEFLELVEAHDIPLTYFELLVAFAYWYFAKTGVDYAVIEVGLGGLLDGTNVVSRTDKVCVITDIGIDHAHILGNTLAEIAAQKAGIMQSGNIAFCFEQSPEVLTAFRRIAAQRRAELRIQTFDPDNPMLIDMPVYQRRNWQLAARVYEHLAARDGLASLSLEGWQRSTTIHIPGRMETIRLDTKTIIMDGAHNFQKMEALVASIRERYADQPLAVLVSFAAGKDVGQTLAALSGLAEAVVITEFKTNQDMVHKPMAATEVALLSRGVAPDIQTIPDVAKALQTLVAMPQPIIVITGSFYLLHQVRALIRRL